MSEGRLDRGLLSVMANNLPLVASLLESRFAHCSTEEYLVSLRRDLWKSMREEAQDQFLRVGPPGDERPSDEENVIQRSDDPECIPSNFLLMLVKPTAIDYLALKTNYREKHNLSSDAGSWVTARLNP